VELNSPPFVFFVDPASGIHKKMKAARITSPKVSTFNKPTFASRSNRVIVSNKKAYGGQIRYQSTFNQHFGKSFVTTQSTNTTSISISAWRGAQLRNFATERKVTVPTMGDSITEGAIKKWYKGAGDYAKQDELVVTIETDKVVVEIRAPENGLVTKTLVDAGASVNVGADLFIIDTSAAAPAEAPKAEAPKKEEPKAQPQAAPKASPPPQQQAAAPKAEAPKKAEPKIEMPKTSAPTGPREQRETMTRLRQRISQRLKDSQNTYALLTTFNEVDMSNIMALREKYKDDFHKKHGVKLGFMSAFIKAASAALKDQPVVNAVIDGNDIVYRNYVDISVAVATPTGLVVPVIRNVDQLSFADVEKTLVVLGNKARDGKIEMEDMAGGTFTISNGGVYGSMMGTPIVNPPQSAILGMHGITKRAVVVNDQIVIRPMMYVALTYDHRLIDGREAVTFLRKIKDVVEDPSRLLLDV